MFPTPQGHPSSYQTCNPWLRCAVLHPGTLSLLPQVNLLCRTTVPWSTSLPCIPDIHIPGIPGTNENAEQHIIQQCLEPHYLIQQCLKPCYQASNSRNHATQSSNGTMLHGPQCTLLPLPLLETRIHMLLGMFLLTVPEMYRENSLSQGRPRWEAQKKPLCAQPFPVSPALAFQDLPSGLSVCSGGQQQPSPWRGLPAEFLLLGPKITCFSHHRKLLLQDL